MNKAPLLLALGQLRQTAIGAGSGRPARARPMRPAGTS